MNKKDNKVVSKPNKEKTLNKVIDHYQKWTEDMSKRLNRKNGYNAVTDAYWGRLPSNWPYTSRVVDPRLHTSLNEKNARLLNSKLRGRLIPRPGKATAIKARLNNAILDYQWDNAKNNGTMLAKWSEMDMDSRLYASKFAIAEWKVVKDKDGNIVFEGNEMEPVDIRNCGIDPTCKNVRGAKWFQYREWAKIEDLQSHKEDYPGLPKLMRAIRDDETYKNDRRDTAYRSRMLDLKGLPDRTGDDESFPVVEIVTEYRPDRWITFSPKHKIILRDIDNPYEHGKIPFVQLKYFPLNDDPLGESEAEAVLPLWRAIQATICGYLDNMNNHIRPPLKIIEGACRIETIVNGPEAQWLVNRQDAVEEMRGTGEALRYFQTTYSALVSAFNTAMGDMSQGVSSIDMFNTEKTATEVRQSAKQQNVRDQSNQNKLSECIADLMGMWLANNKQFLFSDPEKQEVLVKILGSDSFEYFKRAGLDEMEVDPEAMDKISEIITLQKGNLSDDDIQQMIESAKIPRYPVKTEKGVKPKMKVNKLQDGADLFITPDDLDGDFDYIADVRSMSAGANEEMIQGQKEAFQMLTSPQVTQMLQLEGYKAKIKDLLVSILENSGSNDSEKYFESTGEGNSTAGVPPQAGQNGGLPTGNAPIPQNPANPGMAPTQQLPQQ